PGNTHRRPGDVLQAEDESDFFGERRLVEMIQNDLEIARHVHSFLSIDVLSRRGFKPARLSMAMVRRAMHPARDTVGNVAETGHHAISNPSVITSGSKLMSALRRSADLS